jgi:hypothetical protein
MIPVDLQTRIAKHVLGIQNRPAHIGVRIDKRAFILNAIAVDFHIVMPGDKPDVNTLGPAFVKHGAASCARASEQILAALANHGLIAARKQRVEIKPAGKIKRKRIEIKQHAAIAAGHSAVDPHVKHHALNPVQIRAKLGRVGRLLHRLFRFGRGEQRDDFVPRKAKVLYAYRDIL